MRRGYRTYCALAGACDTSTGALLLAAPAWTLRLLGVPPPVELVYVRFLGAFVGGVGLSYFLPWLARHATDARMTTVLLVTAVIRLSVAAFVGAAVLGNVLAPAWSVVWATDLALGAAQLSMVRVLERR